MAFDEARERAVTGVPDITLNNGVRIPQLGFGVFKIKPDETVEATLRALEIGYRHIDTAEMYRNEREVGQAVRESGLARGDVFVTSKLNNDAHAPKDALGAFDRTLDDLGFDYLDLFLIHWPTPGRGDYAETWRAMEEIYRSAEPRRSASPTSTRTTCRSCSTRPTSSPRSIRSSSTPI